MIKYLLILIIAMIMIIIIMFKRIQKLKQDKEHAEILQNKIYNNLQSLKNHEEAIRFIEKNSIDTIKKVKNAKTDEEVRCVMRDIFYYNNSRL